MAPQLGNLRSLPPGLQVIERGWLSSNSVLLGGDELGAVLIDSGYCTHAQQTAALITAALAADAPGRPLRLIVNTHLHSDHCGGNAHLHALHHCPIWIPPGDFEAAKDWDEAKLSYEATGQQCPRFTPTRALAPAERLRQAGRTWEVHAAPGHDPHSIILFEPESRLLISADALWERGFGIVFPEIDGMDAFDEVQATLDLIESLNPELVIPGHGAPFGSVAAALNEARSRLAFFRQRPDRHARHAAKALIMFHLLEASSQAPRLLLDWLMVTPIHRKLWQGYFKSQSLQGWSIELIDELLKSGAIRQHDDKLQPS